MKVRFVGGPFGGKVKEVSAITGGDIIIRDRQKMSRRRQYELAIRRYNTSPFDGPVDIGAIAPMIEARYRPAVRVHSYAGSLGAFQCMHPDGSLFYEYIEGSKREL